MKDLHHRREDHVEETGIRPRGGEDCAGRIAPDGQAYRLARDDHAPQKAERQVKGYVYAIRSADMIKIGYSINPQSRVVKICSDSPHGAELIAMREGTEADEAAYHIRFAPHRIQGEWFRPAPEINAEIETWCAPRRHRDYSHLPSLVRWRKEAGMSIADLAPLLGCSPANLSRIENGKVWPPRDFFLRLHEVTNFAVTANDFVSEPIRSSDGAAA